jgi:putative ABC transport system permease protein
MPLFEIFRQTIQALWQTKLRSFLTMFGIVWGISSVILLVGLGIGFQKDQQERMKNLGTNIAIIFGGRTGAQAGGYAAGREIRLTIDDARAIRDQAVLVKNVSPEIRRSVQEVSQYNAANRAVRGIWPAYQDFRSLRLSAGRRISEQDEQNGERVAVLGDESATQLFRNFSPIGETLMMGGYPYKVIGVLKKKQQNGSYGSGPDSSQLFVPYSAMARDFPPLDKKMTSTRNLISNLVIQPVSADASPAAILETRRILASRHHYDPADLEALWIWDTLEGARFTARIFGVMTIFFGAVAVLTLALGGIGVMNIMLVAVTERTREIGIRKALGARPSDIRRQFLIESGIITVLSGTTGFVLAVGLCLLLKYLPLPEFLPHPAISGAAILASLITLAGITLFAGTYPARRAAGLNPIECLRAE